MTPREIVHANVRRQDPPRPAFDFDNSRRNDFTFAWLGSSGFQQRRWTEGDLEYYDDEWGNIWARKVGGCAKGEVCRPVLPDWSGLESLQLPVYDEDACSARLRERFANAPEDRYRAVGIGGWIFDNARYLRKLEVYLLDMALYPDELERLHELVASVYEQKIHIVGRTGLADAIVIGEDLGTQQGLLFSPAMFRTYFKDLYTRLMGIAHDYGMAVLMHSCGQNTDIVEDLIDCGVNAFQFDQPAVYDMPWLAGVLRDRRVALWAPLDIQQYLPTGDRELIERETERLVELFRGGLILKNYPDLHGIGVDREWDNWFYNRACRLSGVTSSPADDQAAG